MTVSGGSRKTSYVGTGANTVLSTVYPFFEADDLEVQQRVTATGVVTVLTLGVHYTVTSPTTQPGVGSVTPIDGATDFPGTVTWTIVRTTDRDQETDYVENDPFPAATHERGLDKLTLIAQEGDDDNTRALHFPVSDSSALSAELPSSVDRASKSLGFDAAGEPVALSGTVSGSVVVTAFAETLLDDADAATMQATLGLEIGTDVQAYDADLATIAGLAKTDNNVVKGTGAVWESAALDSLEVTHTPTSPVTGVTAGAAINQLSHAYSRTNQTTAQDNIGAAIVALSDLDAIAIPGTGNSAKVYRTSGQVTVGGAGGTQPITVRVHVGPLGTTADPQTGVASALTDAGGNLSVPIPMAPFVPGATDLVTISITSAADGNLDIVVGATNSFLIIEQISNA